MRSINRKAQMNFLGLLVIVVVIILIVRSSNSQNTASITGNTSTIISGDPVSFCSLTSIGGTSGASGVTFVSDSNDLSHYTAVVPTSNSSANIQANLTCKLPSTSSVKDASFVNCYVTADRFTNQITPQSDSNTYFILGTSGSKSMINGFTYQMKGYLQDNTGASTSSDQEATQLQFPAGSPSRQLSVLMVLPGTPFTYLNNQTSEDVKVFCGATNVNGVYSGGVQKYRFTITKITG